MFWNFISGKEIAENLLPLERKLKIEKFMISWRRKKKVVEKIVEHMNFRV